MGDFTKFNDGAWPSDLPKASTKDFCLAHGISQYFYELSRAMATVASCPALFIGQSVAYSGTAMFKTLEYVPKEQRLELPVAEDMQAGMAIGLALAGYLPVCIYPRWNFVLLALNQIVLHLDKLPLMSQGGFCPKVIIRTAVASSQPLYPGPQHVGDYTDAVSSMLCTIRRVKLERAEDIVPAYEEAVRRNGSTILVERMDLY